MMTSTKRTYEETARIHNYDTKRAKNTKNSVILPVVSGPSRRASSNHEFLDDTTVWIRRWTQFAPVHQSTGCKTLQCSSRTRFRIFI